MSKHSQRHTLTALMENRPGVLNRVVSLFRRRGFNLDSLTVGRTERPEVSRMTLVLEGTDHDARRAEAELRKLIQVIEVEHLHGTSHVALDLALIKVAAAPHTWPEILQLSQVYRARVVEVAPDSVMVELTGSEREVESFIEMVRPHGIVEMVRTGVVAMARAEHSNDCTFHPSAWAATSSPQPLSVV